MKTFFTTTSLAAVFALSMAASPAFAAGSHGHSHDDGPNTGMPGMAANVTRTIAVEMGDNFYTPKSIDVKKGETIRFKVKNAGELVHEFNIGTKATHKGHLKEMMAMMDSGVLEADRINHAKMGAGMMQHNDPNSTLLEPGKSGEVIWTFTNDANLEFACNVPGHYEAGMMGKIRFK